MLKFGKLFDDKDDSQWDSALQYLNKVPELNYLTQIVIMLYEDPSIDDLNSEKRFHVEIHFSPGAYADFDAPKYLIKIPSVNKDESKEDPLNSSSNSSSEFPVSPKPKSNTSTTNASDKRSPLRNITKKFPIKFFQNKELQTLHEPPMPSDMAYSESSISEHSLNNESKPRSFEDEHHQTRIQAIKGKIKPKESNYNHYNTFHGSGSSGSYLPLSHVFKTKTNSHGANSSPDLNQNLMIRNKKSLTSKF